MKSLKILMILIACTWFAVATKAQTYIQGVAVRPFSEIANTNTHISTANRMAYSAAKDLVNSFYAHTTRIKGLDKMAGEYFLVDGMVVELTCRNRTADNDFRPFTQSQIEFREMFTNMIGETNTLEADYYDELKTVNGNEILKYYYTSVNYKTFLIQDLLGKYVVLGTIYCAMQDIAKAEAFIDTLVGSIVFK
ncbi:hypothetical protein FAZ19_03765 [Sphingobacterium alkalisoli]|uniref:Uncharacterized protein n=1 Tax=Sphingobacterium alkalisoli TaxID=1874115 RepID=A0A4U0HCM9_9SPHI|nr:hypothetical protein [Sphingobacterium alkalisoli]TJY68382.1 hypothetical protein FAZ19_03765 [Sphingobacterium alkalisoli]GGH06875.1 hypothetical protein GCM10011418_03790 [Sphingobacterium alkalisoli]